MKVLHVINSLGMGGAEKLVEGLVPRLNAYPNTSVELLLLTECGLSSISRVKSQGVHVFVSGNGRSLYDPRHIFELQKYFSKGYDIIHAHLFPTQYFAILAHTLAKTSTKLVFTEHSTRNRRTTNPLFSTMDRVMYRGLDHLVCISEEIRDLYEEYQPALVERTTVIHNGVPINRVCSATPIERSAINSSLKETDKLILQVSSFSRAKDQKTLIKALEFLPEQFKVILAGDGEYRPIHENLTEKLRLSDRVFFLGVRDDVYRLQKMVNYIVLSTHYEGQSLACIEGMASGKPFLASDVKGVTKLVEGGGVLFRESDPKELATKILWLDSHDEDREKVIAACQARANNYSIEECASKHIELYHALLNE